MDQLQVFNISVVLVNLLLFLSCFTVTDSEGRLKAINALRLGLGLNTLGWLIFVFEDSFYLSGVIDAAYRWAIVEFSFRRAGLKSGRVVWLFFLFHCAVAGYARFFMPDEWPFHVSAVFSVIVTAFICRNFLYRKPDRTSADIGFAGSFIAVSVVIVVRDILIAVDPGIIETAGVALYVLWPVIYVASGQFAFAGYYIDAQRLTEAAMKAEAAASKAKSQFLATMSHEIRTPMNGVLGMAQLLLLPDLKEQEKKEYAETILSSGTALLHILNDILDLSKAEADRVEMERHPFEIGEVIGETRDLYGPLARQKGLSFTATTEGLDGATLTGDPMRLRQMLGNLASNAIKFTETGGIVLAARAVGRDGDATIVEFSVTDTGIGIPHEKLAHIFQPFAQGDATTTRKYGGTGLGLSIVDRFAKLMGGEAGVESKAGEGSRFWFRVGLTGTEAAGVGRSTPTSVV